jgi:hypothetical protein
VNCLVGTDTYSKYRMSCSQIQPSAYRETLMGNPHDLPSWDPVTHDLKPRDLFHNEEGTAKSTWPWDLRVLTFTTWPETAD